MVGTIDDDHLSAPQALDDGDLPERPAVVERPGEDPHHLGTELGGVSWGPQEHPTDVLPEVEVTVVDPNRVVEVERDPFDFLAVARHQVQALGDGLLDADRAVAAGETRTRLEDVDGADVEWCVGPLGVQEPSVARGKRFEEGGQLRVRH